MASNRIKNQGVTAVELLITLSILAILGMVVFSSLLGFRKNQALQKDTELVVELLSEARNQTISSKNLTHYGVHFASSTVTVFPGSIYSAGNPNNSSYNLNTADTVIAVSLTGGGVDVVFDRLTGQTSMDGTVVVSSPGLSQTKTVTIFKTGVVQSQ